MVSAFFALSEYASSAPEPLHRDRHPHHAHLDVDYVKLINEAVLYTKAPTPLIRAPVLSEKLKCNVWLKREDLQQVFSFKLRGAYNCMYNLDFKSGPREVVTASAGNHAQGVALSGQDLKIKSTIYMPINTPEIKQASVIRFGGNIVLHGNNFDEAKGAAIAYALEKNLAFVPPFDDDHVIAGQGTIGKEIISQLSEQQVVPDGIFAPIGGGGLSSGIFAYVNRPGADPKTKFYGAEGRGSRAMYESLKAGHVITLKEVDLFADGTAVKTPGQKNFDILYKGQMDPDLYIYHEITNEELCIAIFDIWSDTRSIAEPSGALSVAAIRHHVSKLNKEGKFDPNANFVAVISGGNMDFERLRFIAERAIRNEAFLSVKFKEEEESSFADLINVIQGADPLKYRDITELVYRCNTPSFGDAIFSFKTSKPDDVAHMLKELEDHGYTGTDLRDNETAKSHIRYMVGGPTVVSYEKLIEFIFPERPGVLHAFLDKMEETYGLRRITLFRYRNYGGDQANVLVGMQVPRNAQEQFKAFLEALNNAGFRFSDQTGNKAYQDFLAAD